MIPTVNYSLGAVVLAISLSVTCWAQRDRPTALNNVEDFAEQLLKTPPQERNELLATKKELLTTELRKVLITRGNNLLVAGKYSQAFDVYSLAESVAGQIGDKEGLASASMNIGTVNYFQGNYDLALERYQRARALFFAVGNQAEAAKALSGLGLIFQEQRKDAEALQAFKQALKEFEALDDKDEMANILSSLGSIYYARGDYAAASKAFLRSTESKDDLQNVIRIADAFYMQGNHKQASEYYLRSLKGFEQEKNAAGIVSALSGAANSFYYLGNYDEALEYYQRNVSVQERLGDQSGVAISLQGMGNVYSARGDFGSALESYLKSLTIAQNSNVKLPTATTLGSIGLVRAMQGDNIQAMDYYGKSLAQFETTGDKVGMARMLAQLGNVYYADGSYDTAIESYRKSLALRQAMDDKSGEANLLTGIGMVYLAQKNYAQALENYQKALAVFESLGNKEATADALTKIAEAYLLQGDYTQALNLAERAAALARQDESFGALWYALVISGKAQHALNRPAQANQAFMEAIATLESLRYQSPTAEAGRAKSSLLPYLAEVELLVEQNKPGEAFDYAERAKVQALSDLLRRSNAKITRSMSPAEQAEERKLTGEAISIGLQLDREAQSRALDQVRWATLKDQLRKTRSALAELRKRLYATHPQLKVDRGELPPLKLEETRALLAEQQTAQQAALLEYTITETNVYLFVLTADRNVKRVAGGRKSKTNVGESTIALKVYPLNISPRELAERVSHFYELLASRDEAFPKPARELYDLLLRPAEEQLASRNRLVIVPDGILWRLPFEALQPAQDRFVIEQMSASYAPSLSALREMRKQRLRPPSSRTRTTTFGSTFSPTSPATLAAFGNPLLTQELVQRVAVTYSGETLAPSPEHGSEEEREIQKLKAIYGDAQSRIFVGAGASEERAKIEAGHYGVVHFAARAILDDTSPMFSFIALSPGGKQGVFGQQEDGLLQSGEILNLHSQASLILLSNASVKSGRVGTGDATIALVWSWFIAGTPTTAMSRWRVQSPGLTQLMSEFHTRLRSRLNLNRSDSTADALRQSALTLRRSSDYQHPYYWSGFALMGDGR